MSELGSAANRVCCSIIKNHPSPFGEIQVSFRLNGSSQKNSDVSETMKGSTNVRLCEVVIEGFKCFSNSVAIGPFGNFTCIIGPNGAGKSVVGECIAFALGGTSRLMRGQSLGMLKCKLQDKANNLLTSVYLKFLRKGSLGDGHGHIKRSIVGRESCYWWKTDDNPWAKITEGRLKGELRGFGINTDALDRYIVTQQRRAVVAEDPCKLMAYFEELIGTETIAKQIDVVTQKLLQSSVEICDLDARHESLKRRRKEFAPHVQKWKDLVADSISLQNKKMAFLEELACETARYILELKEEICDLEDVLNKELSKCEHITAELASATTAERKAVAHARKLERDHAGLKRKVQNFQIEGSKLSVKQRRLSTLVKRFKTEMEEHKQACQAAEEEMGQLRDKMKNFVEGTMAAEQKVCEQRLLVTQLSAHVGEDNQGVRTLTSLQARVQQLDIFLRQLESEGEMNGKIKLLTLTIKDTEQEIASAKEDVDRIELEAHLHKAKYGEYQVKFKEYSNDAAALEIELKSLQQKHAHLQAVLINEQGRARPGPGRSDAFDIASQDLLKLSSEGAFNGRFYGRLGSLAICTDSKVLTAVNTVLGHLCNLERTFVVSDRKTAVQVLQYLEMNRIGTAVCIILDECTQRSLLEESNRTYRKPVLSYIRMLETAKEALPAFASKLAKWDLVNDASAAIAIMKDDRMKSRALRQHLVTLQGELFKTDGEIISSQLHTQIAAFGLPGPVGEGKNDQAEFEGVNWNCSSVNLDEIRAERQDVIKGIKVIEGRLQSKRRDTDEARNLLALATKTEQETKEQATWKVAHLQRLMVRLEDLHKDLQRIESIVKQDVEGALHELRSAKEEYEKFKSDLSYTAILQLVDANCALLSAEEEVKQATEIEMRMQDRLAGLDSKLEKARERLASGKAEKAAAKRDLLTLKTESCELKRELQQAERALVTCSEELETARGAQGTHQKLRVTAERALNKADEWRRHVENHLQIVRTKVVGKEQILESLKRGIRSLQDQSANRIADSEDGSRKRPRTNACAVPQTADPCTQTDASMDLDVSKLNFTELNDQQRTKARKLIAEERRLKAARESIDVAKLRCDLDAACELSDIESSLHKLDHTVNELESERECLETQRSAAVLAGVKQVNEHLDAIYHFLTNGQGSSYCSCCTDRTLMFTEGLTLNCRPETAQWRPLKLLSGGQQALACLALAFCTPASLPVSVLLL
eukprot:jgi/Botrbrau1/374/Bobra.110_2s0030.1